MTKTLTEQWREGTLENSYSQYTDLDKPEGYLWLTDENKKLQQQVERLQEQLKEARHTIYCIANTDGSDCKTILETIIRDANLYLEKWEEFKHSLNHKE